MRLHIGMLIIATGASLHWYQPTLHYVEVLPQAQIAKWAVPRLTGAESRHLVISGDLIC